MAIDSDQHPEVARAARGTPVPLIAILAAGMAVLALGLLVAGEAAYAVAPAVLLVLLLAVAMMDSLVARNKVARHGGDAHAVEADSDDAVPNQVLIEDAPLGATPDVHGDLDPHDLPPDHPSRPAVERAAEQRGDR